MTDPGEQIDAVAEARLTAGGLSAVKAATALAQDLLRVPETAESAKHFIIMAERLERTASEFLSRRQRDRQQGEASRTQVQQAPPMPAPETDAA